MSIAIGVLIVLAVVVYLAFPFLGQAKASSEGRRETTANVDEFIERKVAAARKQGKTASQEARRCRKCGSRYMPGDRFCAECGAGLPKERR